MMNREILKHQFLNAAGWGDADVKILAADASNRSYDRLTKPKTKETAVLMNAPFEAGEDVSVFNEVTNLLLDFNLSAPEILSADITNGFLLIEDLGDDLFADVASDLPSIETQLYRAAVDVLVELHRHPAPKTLPPYSEEVYVRETGLLTEWYLPNASASFSSVDATELQDLTRGMCQHLDVKSKVVVLRDYHAQNLIWLPDREGMRNVGLLDYQDALSGHPAYDLASLLEDARRDTSDVLQSQMISYYTKATGMIAETFARDYAILAAQRNLKIIGIFARLCIRDKKSSYVDLIPRVWNHLQKDLKHPILRDLKQWVDKNVPVPDAAVLKNLRSEANGT